MNLTPNRTKRGSCHAIGLPKDALLATPVPQIPDVAVVQIVASFAAYCANTPEVVSKLVTATVSPLGRTSVFASAQ